MRRKNKRETEGVRPALTKEVQRGGVRCYTVGGMANGMTRGIKKKVIGALAAVMAVFLAVGLAFLPARETADAARSTTAWTNIGEIYNDKNDAFDADNLNELYKALTGKTGATFADVQTAAGGNKTSADFRVVNSGNNVSVWFGGMKWDAVYLTKDKSGNVILDLWQSADNVSTEKVGFLEWDAERTDINDTYPANMYSTSKLRVDTLNAGGYCLTSKNKLGAKQAQDNNNQYARFTMAGKDSNGKSSLINYIATPSEVGYQANEFDEDTAADINKQVHNEGKKYYLPNDAYDTPISGGEWFDAEYNNLYNDNRDDERLEEAKYGAWQNDYLWIPSVTEAGCSAAGTGLWNTDISIRSAGSEGEAWFWFRSGYCSDEPYVTYGYFFTFVMGVNEGASDHADWSNKTSSDPNFARPALHLNLSAANSSAERKTIGEIYNDGSKGFDADNLKALYKSLTGKETFTGIKTAAGTNKTSADFRTQSGRNVSVWFGGVKWDATYLTTAKNGDVILDLWRSADDLKSTDESSYSNGWSDSSSDTFTYPSNMYSISKIRVEALNAGGYMSKLTADKKNSELVDVTPQSSENQYARFTMESVADSLTAYIAKPSEVGYQADEWNRALIDAFYLRGNYYFPNDAYEAPKSGGEWYRDSINYASKDGDRMEGAKYGDWKDDYVWLPSVVETGIKDGSGNNGLWVTDAFLRSTDNTHGQGFKYCWLRSGDYWMANGAYYLNTSGSYDYTYDSKYYKMVISPYGVRPAIHLNLTAINRTFATPVTVPSAPASKTYTGGWLTSGITGAEYTVTEENSGKGGVDVGTYNVIISLKNKDDYVWADTHDTNDRTLTFEITKATNTWKSTVSLAGWEYGEEGGTPSAEATFGSVEYTYYNSSGGSIGAQLGSKPTDAGDYYVKASVPASKSTKNPSQNNYEAIECTAAFKISPKTLSASDIRWEGKEFEYDGSAHTPQAQIAGVGETITLEVGVSGDGLTGGQAINANTGGKTYTATATLPATHTRNYTLSGGNTTFTITPQSVTVNWGPTNFIYNGAAQQPSPKATDKQRRTVELNDVTVEGAHTDVGTYYASVTPKSANYTLDNGTNQEFSIEKATLTVSEAKVEDKTYNGKVDDPTITFTFTGYQGSDETAGRVEVESYAAAYASANAGENITVTVSDITLKGVAAGNYNVSLGEYGTAASPAKGKIEKAPLTITLTAQEKEYDGTTTATVTAGAIDAGAGRIGSDDVDVDKITATFDSADAGKNKSVTVASVTLKGTAADNYTPSFEKDGYKATISPKSIPIVWENVEGLIYNGKHQAPTPKLPTDLPEVDRTAARLSVKVNETDNIDAGTHSATAVLGGDAAGNYTISTGETQSYTIGQATITVSGKFEQSKPYDGGELKVAGDEVKGLSIVYAPVGVTSSPFTVADISTDNADVGDYSGNIEITYDTVNFSLSNTATYLLKIERATNSFNGEVTLAGWTYGEEGGTPSATPKFGEAGEVKFTYTHDENQSGTYYDEKPTDAGTYWVKAYLAGTVNYSECSATKEFTISPMDIAEFEWVGEEKDYTYKGAAFTKLTATAKGAARDGDNGTLSLHVEMTSLLGASEFRNVDTYTFTVTLPKDYEKNYTFSVSENTKTIEITPREIATVDWGDETFIYRGEEISPTATFIGVGEDAKGGAIQLVVTVQGETPFRNVEKYTFDIKVDSAHDKNYKLKNEDKTHQYEITVASIEVVWNNILDSYTYKAAAFVTPTATATGVGEDKLTVTVSFESQPEGAGGILKNAGAYQFKATIDGDLAKNYNISNPTQKITVEKDTVAEPEKKTVTYDGTEQHWGVTNSLYTIVKDVGGTDVGIYDVTLKLSDDKNYKWWDGNETAQREFEGKLEITRADLTVTVTASVEYGENVDKNNVTLTYQSGLATRDNKDAILAEAKEAAAFDFGGYTSSTDAGKYKVTAAKVDITNYTVTFESEAENFTVAQRRITVTIAIPTYHTYGNIGTFGAEFGGVGERAGIVNGDEVKAILTFSGTANNGSSFPESQSMPTLAGNYSVMVALDGAKAGNYTLTGDTSQSFTIDRAKLTATITPPNNLTYGQEFGDFTVSFAGVVRGDEGKVSPVLEFGGTAYDGTTVSGDTMPTHAGKNYQVKVSSLTGDMADNYEIESNGQIAFEIECAEITVEWSGSEVGYSYVFGEAVFPTATAQTGIAEEAAFAFTVEMTSPKGGEFVTVGEYTFEAKVKPQDETRAKNFIISGTSQTYHITTGTNTWKAKLTINGFTVGTPDEWKWTYDGTAHTATAEATFGKVKITYSTATGDSLGENAPKDVGIYIVTATVAAYGENYAEISETHRFEIEAKEVPFTFSEPSRLVYDDIVGTYEANLEEILSGDVVEAVLTYSGTPNDSSSPFPSGTKMPTLAGKYSVTLSLGGAQAGNYKLKAGTAATIEFTIEKATVEKPTADTTKFTYTGVEQTYNVVGGGSAHFGVKDDSNKKTNANESGYTVIIALNDKNNYMWADSEESTDDLKFNFIIHKATLAVTARDKEITYGDAPSNDGVEYKGFVNGEKLQDVVRGTVEFDYGGYAAFENVGDYKITLSGLSADNYAFDYKEGTLTVRAKEIEVKWGGESYTYTGTPFTDLPTATAAGIGTDGTFTLLVALNDAMQTFMDAGRYIFKATLDSKDAKTGNYTLKESTTTQPYTVEKATVTAPTIASKVYNGTTQTADIEVSALYTAENDGGTIVGDYPVKLTLTDSKNYKWTDSETADILRTFTITQATYDMGGVTFTGYTVIFDGEAHSIEIEGALPQGVEVNYTGNAQTAVDEYTVTANFTGDEHNYFPIPSKTAVLTIIEVSEGLFGITFEDVTVKYDGEEHSIFIAGELRYGATVSYENNGQTEPNIYTVTVLFRNPNGVVFAQKEATLTILRTYTQSEPQAGSGSSGSSNAEVTLDSAEGFDPTLELVVEKIEDVSRKYLAWEEDVISKKYAVKMYRNGEEVPFGGKVTVRLLIPEEFRDKNFELMALTGARAQNVSYTQGGDGSAFAAAEGLASVNFRRDGDYVVFEADGLSEYVFTVEGIPYMTILLTAAGISLASVMTLIGLAIVIKKNKKGVK